MRPILWMFLAAAGFHLDAAPPPRWGTDGHQIVARLAATRIAPATAAEVSRLLGGQSMAAVSTWADMVRRDRPATAAWHFVDIEVIDSSYVPSRDCKDGACIIDALATQTAILADRTANDSVRSEALKWVIHFVGDLHQPLHGSDRYDKGGNDVKLTFQGKQTNLHSLWDTGLLLSQGLSDDQIVDSIVGRMQRRPDLAAIANATTVQWAMESHDLARDVVYRLLPQGTEIGPDYVAAAMPVINERLLRAGVRLAAVLDRALAR